MPMSYIPKYIIKRIFSADCVKKVAGGVEITMVNVMSPIKTKDLPADATKFIHAKIDGKPVPEKIMSGLVITSSEGKKYDSKNLKELSNQVLPVGGKWKFFIPYTDVKVGEEHELAIDVKETKFQFTFSRVVT
jgi:hypothetical protein